jgi:protein-L-isoaspartate(D-aspartate) O-methyltransferase
MKLVDSLIKEKWLKTERIIKAFKKVERKDFMPEKINKLAEINEAMPIGKGQTISQPTVVAFMLELLQPERGDKILDIGSGSGWTTALLSQIAEKVIAVEVIAELKEFGEKNAKKYSKNVEFILGDGSLGYSKEAPYDKILASASAKEIPNAWRRQLKVGGRIVAPVKESIWLLEKKSKDNFKETEYKRFLFVPLV